MPIVPRGQSFQATINHRGKRFRRQFPSELDARLWGAEVEKRLARGEEPGDNTAKTSIGKARTFRARTIGQLSEYLITHRWRGTKGEKGAVLNLRHIVRIVGADIKLQEVTSHTVNLAILHLRNAGYPDATINKKVSPLRVCPRYALEQGWIERLPTMPFFKPGQGRMRYFTNAEEKAMLNWCRARGQFDLLDYIVVSMDTGLRQGEVLTLKSRNIQASRITIWGQRTSTDNGTKAVNTRTVPLTERALEALARRTIDNPGHLFAHGKDQVTRMWNEMRDALGFKQDPEYVPHAMRHTFCSRLVMAKVNLLVVQRLAGHLRIETTCKYVHLDDDILVSAIQQLEPAAAP